MVFKFGRKYELTPETCDPMRKVECSSCSDYEARVVTPEQAHSIWNQLKQPESTLVLLITATGLRISEALGLKWSDIDWLNEQIHVRRSWTLGQEGKPKSRAS